MVKQDLSEFMATVQEDTTCVIADTATAVKDQLQVNICWDQAWLWVTSLPTPSLKLALTLT